MGANSAQSIEHSSHAANGAPVFVELPTPE
jgi:hypothetical protein